MPLEPRYKCRHDYPYDPCDLIHLYNFVQATEFAIASLTEIPFIIFQVPKMSSQVIKIPDFDEITAVGTSADYIRPKDRKPYDPTVTFEEYNYYAKKTREEEKAYDAPSINFRALLPSGKKDKSDVESSSWAEAEAGRVEITDKEYADANRLLRLASWGSCEWMDLL